MLTPIARRADLIVEEFECETVIYDQATNEAHCLNPTAAFVWQRCDGKCTIEQLRNELPEKTKQSISERELLDLLDMMAAKGLTVPSAAAPVGSVSRRGVLRKAVAISAAGVMIQSMVAPTAAHASSCRGGGSGPPPQQRSPRNIRPCRRKHRFWRMLLQALFRFFS
jgi:hypothetical protein